MIRRLTMTLVVFAAVVSLAAAQCVVRQRVAVNAAAAVVAPVVAPTVSPVLPLYGASFDSSAQEIPKLQAEITALQTRVQLLESARDSLTSRLAVLEGKNGIQPPAMPKADETPKATEPKAQADEKVQQVAGLPAAYVRTCASCHTRGKNPKGGLALVDESGKRLINQTCEMRLEILRRVNLEATDAAVMPPKGKGEPVNDKEAAELLDMLTRGGK